MAGPCLIWHNLNMEQYKTFSRSEPTGFKERTALERYDHEHHFRIEVARRALDLGEPKPLVVPIRQVECASCEWWDAHCSAAIPADDISVIESGRLSIREIKTLASLGLTTTCELASLDLTAEFLGDYLPEVAHLSDKTATSRLETAIVRAQMIETGEELHDQFKTWSFPRPMSKLT